MYPLSGEEEALCVMSFVFVMFFLLACIYQRGDARVRYTWSLETMKIVESITLIINAKVWDNSPFL